MFWNSEKIKNKLKVEKINIFDSVFLTYEILFKNMYILFTLLILLVISKFIPVVNLMYLIISIYLFAIIILEKTIFNRNKYSLTRIICFILIILLYQVIPLQYIFLLFPYMVLLRNLSINDSLKITTKMFFKNFVNIMLITIINCIIMLIIIVPITTFYATYIDSVVLLEIDEATKYVFQFIGYYSTFITYIFAIQFYILYKKLEYKDIIKGGLS